MGVEGGVERGPLPTPRRSRPSRSPRPVPARHRMSEIVPRGARGSWQPTRRADDCGPEKGTSLGASNGSRHTTPPIGSLTAPERHHDVCGGCVPLGNGGPRYVKSPCASVRGRHGRNSAASSCSPVPSEPRRPCSASTTIGDGLSPSSPSCVRWSDTPSSLKTISTFARRRDPARLVRARATSSRSRRRPPRAPPSSDPAAAALARG